jgi:hypothetical protein
MNPWFSDCNVWVLGAKVNNLEKDLLGGMRNLVLVLLVRQRRGHDGCYDDSFRDFIESRKADFDILLEAVSGCSGISGALQGAAGSVIDDIVPEKGTVYWNEETVSLTFSLFMDATKPVDFDHEDRDLLLRQTEPVLDAIVRRFTDALLWNRVYSVNIRGGNEGLKPLDASLETTMTVLERICDASSVFLRSTMKKWMAEWPCSSEVVEGLRGVESEPGGLQVVIAEVGNAVIDWSKRPTQGEL